MFKLTNAMAAVVLFVCWAPMAQAVVVDTEDGGAAINIVGSWTTSTLISGYNGANYLHDGNADKGTKSVRFSRRSRSSVVQRT